MKVTKQPDGLYTIEADNGKMLINNVGIKCKRAVAIIPTLRIMRLFANP